MDLNTLWFALIGVLFVGFFFLEGFDYGVGILHPFLGKIRHRAADDRQHHRSGLGWQRGLDDHRGRGHVRGLPALVRHPLLGLLSGPGAHAAGPHRSRGRLRVPLQDGRARLAARPGTG